LQIPFGDLKRHYHSLKTDIDEAVSRVLQSGWFILGKELSQFEAAFATYLGVANAIGVGSGTEALHLALVASGVSGGEVITVPNTALPTISAISFANAIPVFVDIDPETFCIDVDKIEEKITPRTKAIVPVHLYGHPAQMDRILTIAEKHGLAVVEDACQAHGAEYNGRTAGTFGDFGCFSFYPSKNLGAFGDGGMVVTNDDHKAEQIRRLRNYGQVQRYYHAEKGFNSRLDDMQAAILMAQLPLLDEWNNRRREIARSYREGIRNELMPAPKEADDVFHVYHLYVIRHQSRDLLREHLKECGVGSEIHYPVPCHLQKAYSELGYSKGDFPIAEKTAGEILSLPIYPELTDDEVAVVIDAVNSFGG